MSYGVFLICVAEVASRQALRYWGERNFDDAKFAFDTVSTDSRDYFHNLRESGAGQKLGNCFSDITKQEEEKAINSAMMVA